jgi:type II secretory pathway predicted ATPase ExeA
MAGKMIILDYYNLQEQPFGATPDSRYLFQNAAHKGALDSLIYGIEAGCGFVTLIAMPGLGKTTLMFEILQILRDKARTVFLFQTIRTPLDLLRSLLHGLSVRDLPGNLVEMQLKLKDLLTEQFHQGKRVVLVIDEAQNLDESVLELVRMLSNFETERSKLIQIILCGQPQLAENMASPELLQLRQRVSVFASLKPLDAVTTELYIAHRLRVAGNHSNSLFTKDALALIAQSSQGIPRNINNLCFNALSQGFTLRRRPIDRDVVQQAIAHLHLGPWRTSASAAEQPAERRTLRTDPVPTWAKTLPMRERWLHRVELVALGFVVVGGAIFGSHLWLSRPAPHPGSTIAQSVPDVSGRPVPIVGQSDAGTSEHLAQTADLPMPVASQPPPVASQPPDTATAASPAASMQANDPASTATPEGSSSLTVGLTQEPVESTDMILVTPGATLLGICLEKFGSCSPQLLRQIHDLNPSLSNPDHIETGQTIRVPILASQLSGLERPQTR